MICRCGARCPSAPRTKWCSRRIQRAGAEPSVVQPYRDRPFGAVPGRRCPNVEMEAIHRKEKVVRELMMDGEAGEGIYHFRQLADIAIDSSAAQTI